MGHVPLYVPCRLRICTHRRRVGTVNYRQAAYEEKKMILQKLAVDTGGGRGLVGTWAVPQVSALVLNFW
jgi:hypothetical protein